MKTKTSLTRNSISRSPLRHGLFLTALVLACFALSPQVRADCQDACLTNNNTVQGDDALISLTTGFGNTAIGFDALFSDTTGDENTATGNAALYSNTTGISNTANGFQALHSNTTGFQNTATGLGALIFNTTGNNNTATGFQAGGSNGTGNNNTATGFEALVSNQTGDGNTADGFEALFSNTTGIGNTANGQQALFYNGTGNDNTANGVNALLNNTTGNNNTAIGDSALLNNTGSSNIGLGHLAGQNLTTGNNNIDIGHAGVAGESGAIRIGTKRTYQNTFIAGISGVTVARGVGVIIDTNGHLGTVVSSARFKDAIKPMDKASEAILALRPVTFRYKHELDPEGIPQFGLLAEEVEKVNPDLVARDEQGKPYTVRYEAVNAMLLNEFLKARRQIDAQQKQIEVLTAGLQKVSVQLELSKPAPRTVLNNQ